MATDPWNLAHPVEMRALRAAWVAKNPTAMKKARANWVKNNPEAVAAIRYKMNHSEKGIATRRKYERSLRCRARKQGLTVESYTAMWEKQNRCCAVCRTPLELLSRNTTVDHDHRCCAKNRSCGKCVRALLCRHCNIGLGFFKDSVSTLQKFITYLEQF
jgi:hypothetical protein